MERKQLRTYVRKGRQTNVKGTAASWNTIFDSPMNISNGQQGSIAAHKEPDVDKNRQLRNRVKRTVVEKENLERSVSLAASSPETHQASLFCDISGEDCVKLSKLKLSKLAVKQTKVKQNPKLAVYNKKVSTEECVYRESKTVAPAVESFSEFDEYALHISTECARRSNEPVNHKTDTCSLVTNKLIKNLQKEVVKVCKKPKRGQKKKVEKLAIAWDSDFLDELLENAETVAEPEICRSAEFESESTGEWCAAPIEHIREASCVDVEPSECSPHNNQDMCYQSHGISLSSTEGDIQEKPSMFESSFLPVNDFSAAMARQHCDGRGLALTSTPHHLSVFERVTRCSRSYGIQLSDIESPSGSKEAEFSSNMLKVTPVCCRPAASDSMAKTQMSMQSVELFPMTPAEIMQPTSRSSNLREVLESTLSSLQSILSLGQTSDPMKLTNKSLGADSTNKETSGLQPDSDNHSYISDEKTGNCDDMSVSDAVLDLSEIVEEEEEQDNNEKLEKKSVDENCSTPDVECSEADSVVRDVDECDCASFSRDVNRSSVMDLSCRNSAIHPRFSAIGNFTTPSRYKLNHIAEELQQSAQSFMEMLSPVPRKTAKAMTFEEKVLLQCEQSDPIPFDEFSSDSGLKITKKIGEGVYGEVFSAVDGEGNLIALKIIPIEGRLMINDAVQKSCEEILPEIMISKALSSLRNGTNNRTENFVLVRSVHCVQGRYPESLLQLWDEYDQAKLSQNDRPGSFPARQLYVVFEFENSGSDLESAKLNTMAEAKAVLTQVAVSLAVAEKALNFEHRDLHWGNVLIAPTEKQHIDYVLDDRLVTVRTEGIKVAVIDFTLSRLTKDRIDLFTNLASDPALFEGQGDYQFDIYREMQIVNGNNWQKYDPKTNVLWVDYLCDKLLSHKRYGKLGGNRAEHTALRKELQQLRQVIAEYDSTCSLVINSSFFDRC